MMMLLGFLEPYRTTVTLGVLSLGLVSLLGCKASQLTSHGTEVTLLETEPAGCEEIGEVVGHGGGASGGYVKKKVIVESATNRARNQAAEMGATHILLQEPEVFHGTGKAAKHDGQPAMGHGDGSAANASVRGMAYKCQPGDVPSVVAQALPEIKNPPATISMAALGTLDRIVVFQRKPATPESPASDVEVLRLDDQAQIQEVTDSLRDLALDPIKYVPTHRVEFVGELGTQSLLYGFGYLKYADRTYRLTTGTFEKTLQLVVPASDAETTPEPTVETEPPVAPEPAATESDP